MLKALEVASATRDWIHDCLHDRIRGPPVLQLHANGSLLASIRSDIRFDGPLHLLEHGHRQRNRGHLRWTE